MVPNGYLLMFGPEHAEEQYRALENHKACDAGTKNIKGSELTNVFPYINNEGIETATFTDNKSEGWIDPFLFHSALKSKAIDLGAEFIKGEVKSLSDINAKTIVSAAGCWTKELLDDIPVVPQKHTVFRVKCPKHIPEMPYVHAVPHPTTHRTMCRLTSEVERDPVHSTRYGRQRKFRKSVPSDQTPPSP